MYPICSILRHHGIDYHIYADDTQLYITFDLSDPTIALDKINLCISDLRTWMIKHKLKINDSKTEFMVLTLTKKRITLFDKKITTQKKSKLAHLRLLSKSNRL